MHEISYCNTYVCYSLRECALLDNHVVHLTHAQVMMCAFACLIAEGRVNPLQSPNEHKEEPTATSTIGVLSVPRYIKYDAVYASAWLAYVSTQLNNGCYEVFEYDTITVMKLTYLLGVRYLSYMRVIWFLIQKIGLKEANKSNKVNK